MQVLLNPPVMQVLNRSNLSLKDMLTQKHAPTSNTLFMSHLKWAVDNRLDSLGPLSFTTQLTHDSPSPKGKKRKSVEDSAKVESKEEKPESDSKKQSAKKKKTSKKGGSKWN
jgi:hypothetical protein